MEGRIGTEHKHSSFQMYWYNQVFEHEFNQEMIDCPRLIDIATLYSSTLRLLTSSLSSCAQSTKQFWSGSQLGWFAYCGSSEQGFSVWVTLAYLRGDAQTASVKHLNKRFL